MKHLSKILAATLLFLLASPCGIHAQQAEEKADTLTPPPSRNIFKRVISYISDANKPKPAKKFDFSILGGPHYSKSSSFGIGIIAAGIFRRDTTELNRPPAQVSIYGDVSVNGMYKIGVEGSNYLFKDRAKLYYDANFSSSPEHYWGIGYEMNRSDANEVQYRLRKTELHASLLFSVIDPHFYFGPVLNLDLIDAKEMVDPAIWLGQSHRTFTNAMGIAMEYNTRDNDFNASRGAYIHFDQLFAPRFLGNHYAFTLSNITLCNYFSVWKGGVIATRLHTRFTYGDTPWGMMSGLGGSKSMRGYWEFRYNDKCASEVTVELRQHLFRRIGIVAWGGVGEVYGRPADIFKGHPLWNAGVGLRWEFKHRVNVRVDYGIGQDQTGFVFSINEAF